MVGVIKTNSNVSGPQQQPQGYRATNLQNGHVFTVVHPPGALSVNHDDVILLSVTPSNEQVPFCSVILNYHGTPYFVIPQYIFAERMQIMLLESRNAISPYEAQTLNLQLLVKQKEWEYSTGAYIPRQREVAHLMLRLDTVENRQRALVEEQRAHLIDAIPRIKAAITASKQQCARVEQQNLRLEQLHMQAQQAHAQIKQSFVPIDQSNLQQLEQETVLAQQSLLQTQQGHLIAQQLLLQAEQGHLIAEQALLQAKQGHLAIEQALSSNPVVSASNVNQPANPSRSFWDPFLNLVSKFYLQVNRLRLFLSDLFS